MSLIYIGRGDWIPGIPARDLSDEEVERHGRERLLASGLYEEPAGEPIDPDAIVEAEEIVDVGTDEEE